MSINRVNISGNLTRDPELRVTQGGTDILGFGVAVNDRRRNPQTGEWEDFPNYVDCTVFGNRATALADLLRKGSKVAIEGKLRWSQWERDGQRRSKLEVIVDEIEFLTPRQDAGGQGRVSYRRPQAYPAQTGQRPAYGAVAATGAPMPAPAPVAPNPAPQRATAAPRPLQGQLPSMPQPAPATYDMQYDEDIPF